MASTSSRSQKVALLADLLRRVEPDEIVPAVGFLAGAPRQGRVGVGYSTIYRLEHEHSAEPSLTIGDLDRAIETLQGSEVPA